MTSIMKLTFIAYKEFNEISGLENECVINLLLTA